MGTRDELFDLLTFLAARGLVKMHAARGEFACNSSSSHSIILLPPGAQVDSDYDPSGEFDDDFTLASSTDKLRYLAAHLAQAGHTQAAGDVRAHLPSWSPSDHVASLDDIVVPSGQVSRLPENFVKEFSTFLSSERVVIHSSEYFADGSFGPDSRRFHWPDYGQWTARHDQVEGHSWWVLFNAEDGTKMRISLEEFDDDFTPSKAAAPELVDIKLTDRCPFELDCGFCYMGSTRKGAHASLEDVTSVVASLAQMGVFEVAFGGGEPTLWPHFEEILAFTASLGVVPNFTTKNFKSLKSSSVRKYAGSVACSVTDRKTFERFVSVYDELVQDDEHLLIDLDVSVQLIPAILDEDLLRDVLSYADSNDLRVTMLGFKSTGRGATFEPQPRPADFWFPLVSRFRRVRFSMDTLMASQSKSTLDDSGVPSWSYHLEEGKFSMYVDPVTMTAASSSFSDEIPVPLPAGDCTDALLRAFQGF